MPISIVFSVPRWGLEFLAGGLLYLGPETALPLASFLAAIIGFILIGWRWIWSLAKRFFRMVTGRGGAPAATAEAADKQDQA
jgi:hypothetical protein